MPFAMSIILPRYNDIAKHALGVVKSKGLDSTQSLDSHNIAESEDRPEGFDRYVCLVYFFILD